MSEFHHPLSVVMIPRATRVNNDLVHGRAKRRFFKKSLYQCVKSTFRIGQSVSRPQLLGSRASILPTMSPGRPAAPPPDECGGHS